MVYPKDECSNTNMQSQQRVLTHEKKFTEYDIKIQELQQQYCALGKKVDDTNSKVDNTNSKIDLLDKAMSGRIESVNQAMDKRMDGLEKKVLEAQIDNLKATNDLKQSFLQTQIGNQKWFIGILISLIITMLGLAVNIWLALRG